MDSGESRQAGFQHYTVLLSQLLCPLPAHVTFAQGAVLPCAISTAAAGMYQESCLHLQLPTIDPKPTGKTLLVWGGASSVGSCAIQLGKASGYEVITTASEYNRAYCKSLGASQVFDYRSPTIRDDIVSALKGKDLVGIYDARSHDDTVQLCVDILLEMKSSKKIITTNPVPAGVSLKGVEALAGRCP